MDEFDKSTVLPPVKISARKTVQKPLKRNSLELELSQNCQQSSRNNSILRKSMEEKDSIQPKLDIVFELTHLKSGMNVLNNYYSPI